MNKELIVFTVDHLNPTEVESLFYTANNTERTALLIVPPLPTIFFLLPGIRTDLRVWYPQELQQFRSLAAQLSIPLERQWIEIGSFNSILQRTLNALKPTYVYSARTNGLSRFKPVAATFPLLKNKWRQIIGFLLHVGQRLTRLLKIEKNEKVFR